MDEKYALTGEPARTPMRGDERINFLQQFFYDIELAWRLFWDKRVSFFPKLIPLAWLAYFLSPIDIAPDVAPVLGQVDDLSLFFIALKLFISLAPRAIVDEYLERMGLLRHGKEEVVIEGKAQEVSLHPEEADQGMEDVETEKPEADQAV